MLSLKNYIGLLLWVGLFPSLVHSQSSFPEDGRSSKESVYHLFENAAVHIVPGEVDTLDILIGNGVILSVGKADEMDLQENTLKHNALGYHIYPSFIELKSAYGIKPLEKRKNNPGPKYDRMTNHASSWNDAIHPELRAVDRFSPNEKVASKRREMGFGISLSHLDDGIARGSSVLCTYGKGTANDNVLASEKGMHYSFEKGSSLQDYPSSLMGAMALLRQTFYDVKWYESGAASETNFSLEALQEKDYLTKFYSQKDKYDLERISKIAAEFDQKYVVYGIGRSYQLNLESFENIEAIVAPLLTPDPYEMSDPDLSRYIDQSELLNWELAPFNPYFIEESGINLGLSADGIEKPKDFFEALKTSVAMGLDPDSAIAALTTLPARLVGMNEKIGQLKEGYIANFFISTGDILLDQDVKIISHWLKGKEYPIIDTDKIKLSGLYDLNIDDNYYELKVIGDIKYKGEVYKISEGDTLVFPANVSQQSRQVSLQFEDSTAKGYFRLSAAILNGGSIWDGSGINPEGVNIAWTAIKDRKSKTEKKESRVNMDSIPVPPNMQYPFKAFGFAERPSSENTLFENATIWTCDSIGILKNASILIIDGTIASVGQTIDPNEYLDKKHQDDFIRIDLKGKHISPGIIDEHSHIAISRGVNEATQASTAEVRIADALNPDDINIFRQLSGGVTTAQLLHGSANPIGGQSAIIKLRWGQTMDSLLFSEAPGFIKFALGENVKQSNWGDNYRSRFPQTRMGVEQVYYDYFYRAKEYGQLKTLDEARQEASKKKRKKSNPNEKSEFRTDIELETLYEILTGERFITCHSYMQSEINMLMHVADSMGFTLNTFTHILEGYKVADKMKSHGASASTFSDWWAYKFEVNDAIPHNASLLNEMGVNVGINSDDAEMGRRLNQEAAKSIKYGGMSEEDALNMVTINPAKMLHIDHRVGSIEVGKDADLVIWSDNPLSVYAIAEATYIDGIKYFDRSTIQDLEQRDKKRRAEIAKKMDEARKNGKKTQPPSRKMERYYECNSLD